MKKSLALLLCMLMCITSFSCVFAADELTVVSATPADTATGITNISTDNENYNDTKWVEIEFSEAVDPSTVSNQTIVITSSGSTLAWETFKMDGNKVKIDISQLASETTYIVTVNSGVKTSGGAALASDYSFSFTTGIIIPVASADNKVIINVAKGKTISSINEGVTNFSVSNLNRLTDGDDTTGYFFMKNGTGANTTAQAVIDLGQTYTILAIEYILPSSSNITAGHNMNIAGRVSASNGDGFATQETSLNTLEIEANNEYGIKVYGTGEAKTSRTLVYAGTEYERSGRYVGFSGTLNKGKYIGTFEFKAYAQITTDSEVVDNFSVVSSTPANAATGVTNISTAVAAPYNDTKWVEIEFSEPVDPATVNSTNITINDGTSNLAWETFKTDGNKVKIDISQLASNTTYTVTASTSLKSQAAGAALAEAHSFAFTTGIIIPVASDDDKAIVNVAYGKEVSPNNSEVELKYPDYFTDGITDSNFPYTSKVKADGTKVEMMIDLEKSYTILAIEYFAPSQTNIGTNGYTMKVTGRVSESAGEGFTANGTSLRNLCPDSTPEEYSGIVQYGTFTAKQPILLDYSKSDYLLTGRYVGFGGTYDAGAQFGTYEFRAYAQINTTTGEDAFEPSDSGNDGDGNEGDGNEDGDDTNESFTVTSTSPANGAAGITNINDGTAGGDTRFVEIEFSEDIINANFKENITIKDAKGAELEFELYKAEGKKAMIDISTFASNTAYTITLGKNITSQSNKGLEEYTFGFTTGIIIPVASAENKSIVNVALNKPYVYSNYVTVGNADSLVDGITSSNTFVLDNKLESGNFIHAMIDLQNTYDILAIRWYVNTGYTFNGYPIISKDTATFLSESNRAGSLTPANNTVAVAYGNINEKYSPITLVYKGTSLERSGRYVGFGTKSSDKNKSAAMFEFEAYAQVEYNISAMSAKLPDGTEKTKYSHINTAVTNTEISFTGEQPYVFTENGAYTFSVDVTDYSQTGSSYMLIAASYNADGTVKEIVCDKRLATEDAPAKLTATVNAYSDSSRVSAIVIKDFDKAGMLLDGFELTRAAQ